MKGINTLLHFILCSLLLPAASPTLVQAQTTPSSVWDQMQLTGRPYKVIGVPTLPKDKKKIPTWIPVTGGVIAGGVITWIVLKDGDTGPDVPKLVATDDAITVTCGQTKAAVSVLSNDTGQGISIMSATGPAGITVVIVGGSLSISGIGQASFTVTYTITDETGQTASAILQLTVVDSEPPTISCPKAAEVNCGSDTSPAITGSAVASDFCAGISLSISFADDNSSLTGCNNTGTITRAWTATDPAGNASQCVQTITVLPDQTAPSITCPTGITVNCSDGTSPTLTGQPTVSDNCGSSPTSNYEDDNSGLSGCNNTGIVERTWTATDACGLSASCTQTITIQDNTPPAISCPSTVTVECNSSTDPAVTGNASAEDACGTQTTTIYEDNTSGLTGCSSTGELSRTWTATDACGNEQACTQTITVTDQTPPSVTCPPATTATCSGPMDPTITGTPNATDNCSATLTTIYEDDDSGVVNCSGDLLRTWTVTDACGNEQSCVQIITITNLVPPDVTCPGSATVQCGNSTDPSATGSASVTYHCGSPSTGTLEYADDNSGLAGCSNTGTIERTWTATDSCGAKNACAQTITVEDTTAPTITCPSNATVQCDGSTDPASTGTATGGDNCSSQVSIVYEDNNSGQNGCNNTGDLLRTWTATDDCDNQQSCKQIITVEDTTAPTITCPSTATAVCMEPNDPSVTGEPTVGDNCTSDPGVTWEDNTTGVVNCVGDLVRRFTVADNCGNSTTCEQIITVVPPACTFTTTFDTTPAHCGIPDGIAVANVSPPSGVYDYAWSNGANGPVLSDVPAGSYSVTITEVPLSCSLTFSTTIGELPAQYTSNLLVQPADCPNGGDISFTVSSPGPGPVNVLVEGPSGPISINNVPNGANVHLSDFSNIVPGTYFIAVNDESTGPACTEQFSVTVSQAPPYTLTVVNVIPPSGPSGNDGVIQLLVNNSGQHPPPYQIFVNDNPVGVANNPNFSITNLPVGFYTIFVFDAFNCPSQPVMVELEAIAPPPVIWLLPPDNLVFPSVNATHTVEHPQVEHYVPGGHIPHAAASIAFGKVDKSGWYLQTTPGWSAGTAMLYGPTGNATLQLPYRHIALDQETGKAFGLGGGQLRLGLGLKVQHLTYGQPSGTPLRLDYPDWYFSLGLRVSVVLPFGKRGGQKQWLLVR